MGRVKERTEILLFETAQEVAERRESQRLHREHLLKEIEKKGECEGVMRECHSKNGVKWIGSPTFYPWNVDERPDRDPNSPVFLCEDCAKMWDDYWDEMWTSYYGSVL